VEPIEEAYAAHSGELYSFAIRFLGDAGLAERAVEDTFLRAWRERHRPGPADRARLFAILREVITGLAPMSAEPPDRSLRAWQVEEAIRRIDDHHRHALIEVYYRGRTCAELATETGIPENTMKGRVHDGLRALEAALAEIAI
jgi:RNA polymerase sigma-70 factor, ECF subfamily